MTEIKVRRQIDLDELGEALSNLYAATEYEDAADTLMDAMLVVRRYNAELDNPPAPLLSEAEFLRVVRFELGDPSSVEAVVAGAEQRRRLPAVPDDLDALRARAVRSPEADAPTCPTCGATVRYESEHLKGGPVWECAPAPAVSTGDAAVRTGEPNKIAVTSAEPGTGDAELCCDGCGDAAKFYDADGQWCTACLDARAPTEQAEP